MAEGERRWSLAAAIASVTVFGLSVGQSGPLLPLLLEQRGTGTTLNGLNAGSTFIGNVVSIQISQSDHSTYPAYHVAGDE